jgi:diguanylate cyclase (GGDEF)-like protein
MKPGRSGWLASATVLAVALLCVDVRAASPVAGATPADTLLAQAEQAKRFDQAHFLAVLKQLHLASERLTPAERWHVRFLDAWQHAFEGDYGKADPILRDIIDHSGDQSLAVRATAVLIRDNFLDHHYARAYALANALMAKLPGVTDPTARLEAMGQVSQMLSRAEVGQFDLALKYARQMKALFPSDRGQCSANLFATQALLYSGKLTSASPEFQQAVDSCLAARQPMQANGVSLDLAGLMIDEGHAHRAIALLQRIAPGIRKTRYLPHIASLPVTLAQAYLSMGENAKARKFALASLAVTGPDSPLWTLKAAYEVLYQAERKAGHDAAALIYYEKYVAEVKAEMDDTKTRALAYQMVKQQVLDKKLKLDALDKKNKILELRQALAGKAQETSRLYIVLLGLVIVAIGLWTFRLKHSQLRFRQMARHDGLTGAFNRQHFLHEAARILQRLQQADAGACLVALDLDHFKRINDTYGHAAGDQALRRVAEICRRELRGSDLFGRLGGEEFGILMPACTCEQGVEIATRIRRSLAGSQLKLDPETTVVVSASLGLAHSAVAGYAFHQLFAAADAALYRAKHGGRNLLAVAAGGDAPAVVGADMSDTADA